MPTVIDMEKLFADLRDVFKKHGWDASDAYDLAKEALKIAIK